MIGTDSAVSASANSRVKRPDDLARAAEITGRLASNLNWNSCQPGISGSRREHICVSQTSMVFPAWKIVASWPGRAFPWTSVTDFSIGTTAPLGLTLRVESHADRIDETTAARVRNFGTEFALAFDRELVPNTVVAAFNLSYQPEWTRFVATGTSEQESTIGAAFGMMVRMRPNILLGGEVRYLRRYEGIGLEEFAGQALFVGPTAYFQLTDRSRLTASWSAQVWGRPAGFSTALDLVNFERHQARLIFGFNF